MTDLPLSPAALILAADDDADILTLIERQLGRAGHRVVTARDGDAALELARVHTPDVVLLDVNMPGRDGHAVCLALHEELGHDTPPVIFLTARGRPEERVVGLDAGAVDYVVKPFDGQELVARVNAALRTRRRLEGLAEAAFVDRLTGVQTRARLEERLDQAVLLARRYGRPLGCVIIDVDHFKSINDTHGHLAGDAVLREVGARLRAAMRRSDEIYRYGGEEFVVLLPDTDAVGAGTAAGVLLRAVAAAPVPVDAAGGVAGLDVRASAGAAELTVDQPFGRDLLAAADRALYDAKQGGRDRVVVARAA